MDATKAAQQGRTPALCAISGLQVQLPQEAQDNHNLPFLEMLRTLKLIAEDFPGTESHLVTVAYPPFPDNTQITQLKRSLVAANTNDSNCHGDTTSGISATWAYRQNQARLDTIAPPYCTHGDFGREDTVCIDHNEDALTVQSFGAYVGENLADASDVPIRGRLDVFLKPPNNQV
jgi:hypothetical protein